MADPEIAPLAQRLAEENNVDWRSLHGTGQGGRIVERDVLEYLARVMAGEEDVDPTAEPLPEGMEAWPDEVAASPGPEAEPEPEPETTAPPDPGTRREPWGDEAPKDEVAKDGAPRDEAPRDEELLLAGDDLIDARGGGDSGLLVGDESGPGEAGTASREREAGQGEPDLFDEGHEASADHDGGNGGYTAAEARPGSGGAPDLFEGDLSWEDERAAQGDVGFDPETGFDLGRQEEPGGAAATDASSGPDFDLGGLPGDETFTEGPPSEDEPVVDEPVADEPLADEPVAGEAPDAEATYHRPREEEGDVTDAPVEDLSPGPAAEAIPAEPAAPAQATAGDVWGGLPLARTRQVLRRQVVLDGALAAQRAAVLEGGNEETALGALLWLAAQRVDAPLSGGRVALARVHGERGVEAVSAPVSGLSELSHALARGTDTLDPATVDLWVADMTGVGLDDVVLDVDGAQLALGRVLRDGDDGTARAMLTLAGEVDVAEGAAFLARIAERIEDPLRLLA